MCIAAIYGIEYKRLYWLLYGAACLKHYNHNYYELSFQISGLINHCNLKMEKAVCNQVKFSITMPSLQAIIPALFALPINPSFLDIAHTWITKKSMHMV